jgi:hypothetical protein
MESEESIMLRRLAVVAVMPLVIAGSALISGTSAQASPGSQQTHVNAVTETTAKTSANTSAGVAAAQYAASTSASPAINPEPLACGPGNDGDLWYDEVLQQYFICALVNGKWGWYIYIPPGPGCGSVRPSVFGKESAASC